MSDNNGKFVWYELATPDRKGAETFYRAVVGWGANHMGEGDMAYTILKAGDVGVGGIAGYSPDAPGGAKPAWRGYIAVADVDGEAKRVGAAGGKVTYGPDDIPAIGRFAMATDPQGTPFVLFKPLPPAGPIPPEPPLNTPGHFGWRELISTDGAAGFDFYSGMFGWAKSEAIDMGPMGTYQLYAREGEDLGGMMTGPPGSPAPYWLYYINVDAIGAAVDRLTKAGGSVIMGPHQVPGGNWIVQGVDPQGVMFALSSVKA